MSGSARAARYVSLLSFSDAWLDRLRAAAPDVEVRQFPNARVADLPGDVRRTMTVLHTSTELPDPATTPALRLVQLDTSGVDHVHGTPLWRSGVPIATIGGVSPMPLAEYVLFMVLGFAHRMPALLGMRAAKFWPSPAERWERMMPAPLAGATLGVVGYGRIGREIGRQASAQGMHVLGINRLGRPAPNDPTEVVGVDALGEAVRRCDYLVVICPLTDATRGLIDKSVIESMKPGTVLVNVARGGIVDEAALLAAVRSGQLAGAALDVFDEEPLPFDSPWWDEPTVVVTPHVAGLAPRYDYQVLEIVAANLHRLADGSGMINLVDRDAGY